MKRIHLALGILLASSFTAGAASATSLSLSMGSGGQLNTGSGTTSSVAPLATEFSVGFSIAPNVTLDAGFLFAHDIDSNLPGNAKSSYLGFRPGIRAYGGQPWSALRPYFRVAIPVQYTSETKTADIGILVGGGLEYRIGRMFGVFGEALVTPYFTNGAVPIEGRVGVSVHF